MDAGLRTALRGIIVAGAAASAAFGQSAPYSAPIVQAAWTPVGTPPVHPARNTSAPTERIAFSQNPAKPTQVPQNSPYYTDAPIMYGHGPTGSHWQPGTANVSPPLYQSAPVPGTPTYPNYQPPTYGLPTYAATQQAPVAPQYAMATAQPPAIPVHPGVGAGASLATAVEPKPRAPFVDHRVFMPGGQEWREYDISAYSAKFPPSASAESAVREWILRETGRDAWLGMEVTSLAITPERVRIYHNAQVQDRVAEVLGRFINYNPGRFNCRVKVWNVTDIKWRTKFGQGLQSVGHEEPGREAWAIRTDEANKLIAELGRPRRAKTLAHPQFTVVNGQPATVHWAKEEAGYVKSTAAKYDGHTGTGFEQEVEATDDGVTVRFSPLIAADASSIDVDVSVSARKLAGKEHTGGLPLFTKHRVEVSEVPAERYADRIRLPTGKHLLVSVGIVPSFDGKKGLLGRHKKAELLVLIEIDPEANNTAPGVQLAAKVPSTPVGDAAVPATVSAPGTEATMTTGAKIPSAGAPKENQPEYPPSILTKAVY